MTSLRELARPRATPTPQEEVEEHCDLCAALVPPMHRHLIDVDDRRLLCVCRPCSILFDHRGAGGGHFRLLPDRARFLPEFDLDDMLWQRFEIPVELAFFFHNSPADRVVGFYPAPAGATESLLELEAWEELVARNPVLEQLEPDVEALLVNRTRGVREYWLAPVDRCYELVGVIRTHWKGFRGGEEVWREVDEFFERLRRGAKAIANDGKETEWPVSRTI